METHGSPQVALGWVAEHADAAIVLLDVKGRVLRANSQAHLFAQKALGPRTFFWQAYCKRGTMIPARHTFLKLIDKGGSGILESSVVGRHLQWRIACQVWRNRPVIVAVGLDDTHDWRVAQERRDRLEALVVLTSGMPDPIFIKDGEGNWKHINEAARQLFDLDGVDYHNKSEKELTRITAFYREALSVCRTTDQRAWKRRRMLRSKECIRKPDGTVRILETFKIPLFYPDGSPKALVVIGHDITARTHAESALRAAEAHLRAILDATQDAILVTSPKGNLAYVNPPMQRLLHCKAGGTLAQQSPSAASWSVAVPGNGTIALGDLCTVFARGLRAPMTGLELEIPERDDGSAEVFSLNIAPLSPAGSGTVVAAQDITRRVEAESMKSEFFRTVAHELRTPLMALQLGVDRCERRLSQERAISKDIVCRMNAQVGRLTEIVNAMLDVALIETGGPARELHVLNITQLVRDAVSTYRKKVPNREILLDGAGHGYYTIADPQSIRRVLKHILDNAVRYSNDEIRVAVTADTANVYVSITDLGPGIPFRYWQRLFTMVPGIGERTLSRGGLGLNLYICRRLIQALGGNISASPGFERGTRFLFSLPHWHAKPDQTNLRPASVPTLATAHSADKHH